MLDDDVASNKAIGSYGSRFLQDQRKIVPRFSVLTHCNTGSLATAGYGTALGVICALHAEGVLERAYCTETRPFNQGSRLTAFELVHYKIPATLIADSAAAALMKESRLSAVIVGADHVAANALPYVQCIITSRFTLLHRFLPSTYLFPPEKKLSSRKDPQRSYCIHGEDLVSKLLHPGSWFGTLLLM
ncbi:hypothetical protein E1A91_D07G016200v1 [Gossypium mustelinum]|uniref:S-methyl-5-thioribose-1-phosphate isomerase n=1 Tax=Gossypium mustelinum TaxID=34275 RepID=A0A5D2U306_GOSMU|nr:hypothetical protein E1A91_D07G016200v1 [Gossypium mustelinum]